MTSPTPARTAPPRQAPVRGAQTFAALMGVVWKRPILTAIEIAWRWLVCAPLLWFLIHSIAGALARQGIDATTSSATLSTLTVFQPVESLTTLRALFLTLWAPAAPIFIRWLPVFLLLWSMANGLGRTLWLRRPDPGPNRSPDRGHAPGPPLAFRPATVSLIALLKLSKLLTMLALWFTGWALALRITVLAPVARGEDANLVPLAALIILWTLVLFMAWSLTNWVLQLAPLIAMRDNVGIRSALVRAIRAPKELRGKLIETNLVMGIVKVALLVLWMVFNATPLPFSTNITPDFLHQWWTFVTIVWLVFSDYFHVVRTVAYLRLFEHYAPPPQPAESAS